jgi:hypothetical protein
MNRQWYFDKDNYQLASPDARRHTFSPIDKRDAERSRHGARAHTAEERAVVVYRMLVGEREWSDGWERLFDDCFEMNDGDDVVCHIVDIAESLPTFKRIICGHSNVGEECYKRWQAFAARRPSQQALAL